MKPPKSFKSLEGRTFTIGQDESDGPACIYQIFFDGKPAGYLFDDDTYTAPLRWHASTRDLVWTKAADAPTGVGFDVAAFKTVGECLLAWGRSADQILDWAEGKPIIDHFGREQRKAQ